MDRLKPNEYINSLSSTTKKVPGRNRRWKTSVKVLHFGPAVGPLWARCGPTGSTSSKSPKPISKTVSGTRRLGCRGELLALAAAAAQMDGGGSVCAPTVLGDNLCARTCRPDCVGTEAAAPAITIALALFHSAARLAGGSADGIITSNRMDHGRKGANSGAAPGGATRNDITVDRY